VKTNDFRFPQATADFGHCSKPLMRRWTAIMAVMLAAVLSGGGPALASERWETLQAINWVENPYNSPKAGPGGELGPYQFRPATWRMYTRKPFALAVERQHSDDVAVRHYEWIKRSLLSSGIDPTPFYIALAWNAGLGKVVNGRVPASAYEYASQVTNLVGVLKARQLAAAVALGTAGPLAGVPESVEPAATCGGALIPETSLAWAGRPGAWLPLPRAWD
jgi:hypothetical protein